MFYYISIAIKIPCLDLCKLSMYQCLHAILKMSLLRHLKKAHTYIKYKVHYNLSIYPNILVKLGMKAQLEKKRLTIAHCELIV